MAKIQSIQIKNFKGIKSFNQAFDGNNFICLIGSGDSGKSTILEAISLVLSPNWNIAIHDNDFYKGDTKNPIEIIVNLINIPSSLISETKFGLHLRGYDSKNSCISDEITESMESLLTIKLTVEKDLEPKWHVINSKTEDIPISASDRSKFNVFMVSDYIDRHFSWSKGNPLFTLLKEESKVDDDTVIIDALREAKKTIDKHPFDQFKAVLAKIQNYAKNLGVDITNTNTSIDFKDLVMKDGKVSLHEENIPFRLKGKGTKRLISIAIQTALAESGGILLIDEIEQGLEPHRAQFIVNSLKKNNIGQIFIATHSRDVIVELEYSNLFQMRATSNKLIPFTNNLQGLIRAHPEALFAKKLIVCEGATEIGIMRSLSKQMIERGNVDPILKGIRFVDGGGKNLFNYANGFHDSQYEFCVFCDSDDFGTEKKALSDKGIPIFDWNEGDCLEVAIVKDLPWVGIKEFLELSATLDSIEKAKTFEESLKSKWDSIKSKYGSTCADSFETAEDTPQMRSAIGLAANKGSWFKNQSKGESLGDIVNKHRENMDTDCKTNKILNAIAVWIEQ